MALHRKGIGYDGERKPDAEEPVLKGKDLDRKGMPCGKCKNKLTKKHSN